MSENKTPKANSPAESLKSLFATTAWVINETTKDFTDADGLFQPQPAGNCANWVLGHLLRSRMAVIRSLGGTAEWEESKGAQYARGTAAITEPGVAIPFTELLATFNRSQDALTAALDKGGDEVLAKMGKENTRFDELLFFHFHESYHSGQLSLIRRLLGKDGVIK